MQSVTDRQWLPPGRRWRSCPEHAGGPGSSPGETTPGWGSARADSHQHDPAVVHSGGPPQYFPPARSVARVGQNSGRATTLDAPSSKPYRHRETSARDAEETHSTAGAWRVPRELPLAGRGSDRALPHVLRAAPRLWSAVRLGAAPP